MLIKPTLVGDLKYVNASTESLYGIISVSCTRSSLTVDIPVGSDATIVLPDGTESRLDRANTHSTSECISIQTALTATTPDEHLKPIWPIRNLKHNKPGRTLSITCLPGLFYHTQDYYDLS